MGEVYLEGIGYLQSPYPIWWGIDLNVFWWSLLLYRTLVRQCVSFAPEKFTRGCNIKARPFRERISCFSRVGAAQVSRHTYFSTFLFYATLYKTLLLHLIDIIREILWILQSSLYYEFTIFLARGFKLKSSRIEFVNYRFQCVIPKIVYRLSFYLSTHANST